MWIIVVINNTSRSAKNKPAFYRFCNKLTQDGFVKLNKNLYTRYCFSYDSGRIHGEQILNCLPHLLKVDIFSLSDKQYESRLQYPAEQNLITSKKISRPLIEFF